MVQMCVKVSINAAGKHADAITDELRGEELCGGKLSTRIQLNAKLKVSGQRSTLKTSSSNMITPPMPTYIPYHAPINFFKV